jgi:hypothetical protein
VKQIKSIWLVAVALLSMSKPSADAASVLRLSPELQEIYYSWNHESKLILDPYIEYRCKDTIYKTSFFSKEDWFATSIEIPSNLLEFNIYLPTTKFGNYVKFTFSPEKCIFSVPDFSHVDKETLPKISSPRPRSFITDGLYLIDIKYILNAGRRTCGQCILTPTFQTANPLLVAISDIPA